MSVASIAALFGAMAVLAAIPSISVLAVSTRSATHGFVHGAFVTLGIVTADVIFILVAVLGLSALAASTDGLIGLVRIAGGAYLVWLGIGMVRQPVAGPAARGNAEGSLRASFLTGLSITLGDQKAILFYLGFLPAFMDLSTLSARDTGVVIVTAIIAVGGVKLGYAWLAARSGALIPARALLGLHRGAGVALIALGIYVMVKP